MNDDILVFDTGQSMVGIYSVSDEKYIPYMRGQFDAAIKRLKKAHKAISYNGKRGFDYEFLNRFAQSPDKEFNFEGEHIDMRIICWSDRIWGSDLESTYFKQFGQKCSNSPFSNLRQAEYIENNEKDVYMTFKLWECFQDATLKIIDGHEESA